MNVNILADSSWESKLDHAMKVLDCRSLAGDFGTGLDKIVICLMCRSTEHEFKQRVRHTQANATLGIDVMLDLESPRDSWRLFGLSQAATAAA